MGRDDRASIEDRRIEKIEREERIEGVEKKEGL